MATDRAGVKNRPIPLLPMGIMIFLSGCVAGEADLRKAEKDLQQQLVQTRARQSQEISTLREHELPLLRGEIEKVLNQVQALRVGQDLLHQRTMQLEQQTKTLDQSTAQGDSKGNAQDQINQTGLVERFDSLDVVIGKILLRLDELEKRLQVKSKR